ncbi:stage II sporulation protein E [Clostridium tagluense]|uniref:stage II sporulation protein E n=1 Tax=Clostridium tagluense TaxID=360422 RepID=UPI001CF376DC|nr:stage II sporulation protein E [Clostridium tagluense]MCB2313877.1 stage II sporulation protein E [Clostridium tagluense]MCB2318703.1 stage II sporulation protein E [Clostridium tagluense]MCB2323569.1 stage II sporulation protein E [Clostridium tagluense]MCB2328447.1 stage II sporulation protein E [Clostridium tagluense]MCB2333291.1 stage II sporulation protein E [Clostridium tagluense]
MQYGIDIFPYQRLKKIKEEVQKKNELNINLIIRAVVYFTVSLLISRVLLINNTAPFGIAFLIATIFINNKKISIITASGTFLGYITLYKSIVNLPLYLVLIVTIAVLSNIFNKMRVKTRALASMFSIIIFEMFIYNFFIIRVSGLMAFLNAMILGLCIFPLYFILDYSLLCFKEIKTKHIFSNEEIISMSIISSLIIAGTWGLSVFNISITNILGLAFVIIIAYINGSGAGAASGVAMGIIVGMSSKNMIIFIGMYGICGLITGVFKETGKWLSAAAYLVAFSIIKIYCITGSEFIIFEAMLAAVMFLLIPLKVYAELSTEFNADKKREYIEQGYINKIKDTFVGRLNNFSDVLSNMSDILNNLVDNERLAMKGKSSALVENLADRVCSDCNMKSMCWKRELHYTYAAFEELIQNFERKSDSVPDEIERKCIKRTALLKNTEDIVNKHIINEMWRTRLSEGRELLANQISNMADSVSEIVEDFNSEIQIDTAMEKLICRALDKNSIKYNELMCLNDKTGRMSIKFSLEACSGRQMCVKELLPIVNGVTGKCMCVSDEGCSINPKTNMCKVTMEETPKFHVVTNVARQCKDGEKFNGDSYSFGKLMDGSYMSIISDGMGSGPEAGRESEAAVELIEKFTSAGFSKITAINTVNSIMTLRFSQEEKFSTIDLSSIDLYTGEIDFMKVGAVATFLKSGDRLEIIKSKSLPIGVLDKADIDIQQMRLKNGDIIVMLSDGVLDYNDENVGRVDWIVDYLGKNNCNNPKELADGLLSEAKKLSGNRVKDDMTVLVSKIYSLY